MTTQSTTDPLSAGTSIGRTALRVAALDELTAFYRDVVGLEVLSGGETSATLGAGEQPLLVLEAAPDAPGRPETATGLYHTAFRVPSRVALGDALGRVRDRWRLDGASDHLVSEALYLTDPEGNGVEIYRDRPRDDWPRTETGAVRMATEPLDIVGVAAAADVGAGEDGTGGIDGDEVDASSDRAPAATDVGHVHLEVSSLDDFRAFYVDVLGFEQQTTYPGASFVSAGGYHHHVGANTWNERTTPGAGRGLAWFEVVLPAADALDDVRERLAADGVAIAETTHGIAVSDPDGVELRLRANTAD